MQSKTAARFVLALGVLLTMAAPAVAQQDPQTRETAPEEVPTQPTDDGFGQDETFENIQENPSGAGGALAWWGPLLMIVAVVAGLLVFRHVRTHGRRER